MCASQFDLVKSDKRRSHVHDCRWIDRLASLQFRVEVFSCGKGFFVGEQVTAVEVALSQVSSMDVYLDLKGVFAGRATHSYCLTDIARAGTLRRAVATIVDVNLTIMYRRGRARDMEETYEPHRAIVMWWITGE